MKNLGLCLLLVWLLPALAAAQAASAAQPAAQPAASRCSGNENRLEDAVGCRMTQDQDAKFLEDLRGAGEDVAARQKLIDAAVVSLPQKDQQDLNSYIQTHDIQLDDATKRQLAKISAPHQVANSEALSKLGQTCQNGQTFDGTKACASPASEGPVNSKVGATGPANEGTAAAKTVHNNLTSDVPYPPDAKGTSTPFKLTDSQKGAVVLAGWGLLLGCLLGGVGLGIVLAATAGGMKLAASKYLAGDGGGGGGGGKAHKAASGGESGGSGGSSAGSQVDTGAMGGVEGGGF